MPIRHRADSMVAGVGDEEPLAVERQSLRLWIARFGETRSW